MKFNFSTQKKKNRVYFSLNVIFLYSLLNSKPKNNFIYIFEKEISKYHLNDFDIYIVFLRFAFYAFPQFSHAQIDYHYRERISQIPRSTVSFGPFVRKSLAHHFQSRSIKYAPLRIRI